MRIINLCDHEFRISDPFDSQKFVTIPKSGLIARRNTIVSSSKTMSFENMNVNVRCLISMKVELFDSTGRCYPFPEENTKIYYIVSRICAEAMRDRNDIFCPSNVRTEKDGNQICENINILKYI